MRTTDFCPIPRINRAPCIRVVSAPSTPFGARTGADGVSRRRCALRWSRLSLERALSSRRVETSRATSDTPVALRNARASDKEIALAVEPRPIHFASRERYGATPAGGAFALCVTPELRDGSRVNPVGLKNHSLALVASESGTMPIARTSRGRCNTTRDQVALANSRVLATRFVGLSPDRANDG